MTDYGWLGLFWFMLIPFLIIDVILRGFALWKSARKKQKIWFITLLVINSAGILPLIYLLLERLSIKPSGKK